MLPTQAATSPDIQSEASGDAEGVRDSVSTVEKLVSPEPGKETTNCAKSVITMGKTRTPFLRRPADLDHYGLFELNEHRDIRFCVLASNSTAGWES